MASKRWRAPSVQELCSLTDNHNGAYTFITNVARVTSSVEGLSVLTYSRSMRHASVKKRAWHRGPISKLAKAFGQSPFATASTIRHRYCWSVLKSVESRLPAKSVEIGENSVTGSWVHVGRAFPMGRLNARGPFLLGHPLLPSCVSSTIQ